LTGREFQDPAMRERIPDPTAAGTFLSAKLAWDDLEREPHSAWLSWYQRLLAVRHREFVPRMSQIREGGRFQSVGENALVVRWSAGEAEWSTARRGSRQRHDNCAALI
jgi:1,4-alpha-glucan branching enzyme